jgi:predicted phage terminase large subunit-like protein
MIFEPLRYISTVKGFGAVIFRRTTPEITNQGGLWDEASAMYPYMQAEAVENRLLWRFPPFGNRVKFSHLQYEKDLHGFQGSQIPLIGFDELTHFTKAMFFYMLSRNRSGCGVKPYVRCTTNPDPDSWVREFIDWWIGDDGFAVKERSGVIRWLIHQNNEYFWFNTKKEALEKFGKESRPKSVTFITASVYDNKILLETDPNYIGNLEAQSAVQRARLLDGNWDARATAGDYFKRSNFEIVEVAPKMKRVVRCWDLAGTKPSETNHDPDWTVGLKVGVCENGVFYVLDCVRVRENPAEIEALFKAVTTQDGKDVFVRVPQDAGSAGKVVAHNYIKMMSGYKVTSKTVSGDKEVRATPASGQAGIGNIKLLRGDWNEAFIKELELFPPSGSGHDDQVDALSDCIEELTDYKSPVRIRKKPKIMR